MASSTRSTLPSEISQFSATRRRRLEVPRSSTPSHQALQSVDVPPYSSRAKGLEPHRDSNPPLLRTSFPITSLTHNSPRHPGGDFLSLDPQYIVDEAPCLGPGP